ncbi:MAG: hypothetical protein AB7O96_09140 [Pseudobdellovibrionaceae bacterium]
MKNLLTLSFGLCLASFAHAGKFSIQDMNVSNVVIKKSVNLRAEDGSTVSVKTKENNDADLIKSLPPAKNADQSLCKMTNPGSVDHFIKVMDIVTKHIGGQSSLTSEDVKLIVSTPRCEFFTGALAIIAKAYYGAQDASTQSDEIKSASIYLQGNPLIIFKMKSGKNVRFQLQGSLKAVNDPSDLGALTGEIGSSGQGFGLRFTDGSSTDSNTSEGSDYCRANVSVRVCPNRNEYSWDCRTEFITVPGRRSSTTTLQTRSVSVVLVGIDGSEALSANLADSAFITDSGSCEPLHGAGDRVIDADRWDRRDHGRDGFRRAGRGRRH